MNKNLLDEIIALKADYEKLNKETQAKIDYYYEQTGEVAEKADISCFAYREFIRKLDDIINEYQSKKDTADILKDLYNEEKLEDFMIETFGFLINVSDLMFDNEYDPQKVAELYIEWKNKQKEESIEQER